MVDVLLTHSYHLFYDPKQVRKMQPYPPLGTLYAAALLRQHGFSVALFDTMLEDPERGFPAALQLHRPRLVAVYEDNFNFLSKMCLTRMREVAFGMVEYCRAAGAVAVVNGSDASDHVAEYLERGFDYVLLGEAEWTLLDLANSLDRQPLDPEQVPGLAFRRGYGEVMRTPPRPLLPDLNKLPLPARDLVDINRYRELWKASHGFFSLNATASRGCPFRCNWCAKPIYGNSFHIRSAESVAEEMHQIKTLFGAEHIWFADDIFALKPGWARELADGVDARGAVVPFKMQSRVDLMTTETVKSLRRAGCKEVWMGVESGSQKVLDAMDKGTKVEYVPIARENLRRCGIRACFFLQFGYPGETWEDIQQTIRLVRSTRPEDIGVSVAYPLPGTEFYRRVREELGSKRNWMDSDDLAVIFKGRYPTEFYLALRDALHEEVKGWAEAAAPPHASADSQAFGFPEHAKRTDALWKRVERLEKGCRAHQVSCSALPA
ncbi:MAG: B12-binding domain-containing radical SAM protein [Terriglobia bacterium]